jgi:hypothetical protein
MDGTQTNEAAGQIRPWDPFQIMDRLDEEALRKELEGIASTDLVYVVREGNQEVAGLSKTGVDECCMALVAQGQVIREDDLQYELIGEAEDREALFKVKAARFAVSPAGEEVRLDQVIGVKRQPLYYDSTALDLDSKVPSRKYRGRTFRELLASDEGRGYLEWMAENFNEPEIRDFVRQILAGNEVVSRRSRQLNPHWYEHGAMKAARNARFRLIPGTVRAQIMALAMVLLAVLMVSNVPYPVMPRLSIRTRKSALMTAFIGATGIGYRIRIMLGDRVRIELSPYDLTRGRIVYRYR